MSDHDKPLISAMNNHREADSQSKREVTLLSIVGSVFAAFFGIQKDKNRRRDFESGKFWHFFVAGLMFVAVFLMAVWGAVKYILATTPTG